MFITVKSEATDSVTTREQCTAECHLFRVFRYKEVAPYTRSWQTQLPAELVEYHEKLYWQGTVQDSYACTYVHTYLHKHTHTHTYTHKPASHIVCVSVTLINDNLPITWWQVLLIFHAKSQLDVCKSGIVLQLKCSYCHGCVFYDAAYPVGLIIYEAVEMNTIWGLLWVKGCRQ